MKKQEREELLKLINTVSQSLLGYTVQQSNESKSMYLLRDSDDDIVFYKKNKYLLNIKGLRNLVYAWGHDTLQNFPKDHKDYIANIGDLNKLADIIDRDC